MSADNGLYLKHTPKGWELREYCASVDIPWSNLHLVGIFQNADEALIASQQVYTEYGVTYLEGE